VPVDNKKPRISCVPVFPDVFPQDDLNTLMICWVFGKNQKTPSRSNRRTSIGSTADELGKIHA
jgi:hypothetical protein